MRGIPIAIIGMAGRFSGSPSLSEYWKNLLAGRESIAFFTDEQLRDAGVAPELLADKRYVKAAPTLEGIDLFDSELFSYSKKEADILDPQHRLLLECAWETIEDAGYAPNAAAARIGVFAGSSGAVTSYLLTCLAHDPGIKGATGGLEHLGNDKDFVPTRVSYELNLTGPSVAVQTACSTSLVSVHLACQSLLVGDCDMALAGGVSVRVPQIQGYVRRHGDIFSADGHCRAFDARATGIVFGSGVGLVLLKPLEAALRDGDSIQAVLLATAINNDGGKKISYTASSSTGQTACMDAALDRAGINPETLGLVEAHGTGTAMGDPVEVTTLTKVFRRHTENKTYCALGSVKNNIGHLDTASGVAGLIKAVLALRHGRIPPTINFETPNPKIDFPASPFYVNSAAVDWPSTAGPRRAAVNSLGIGGTNAFAILEQAPRATESTSEPARRARHALCLSARGPEALADYARKLSSWLLANPGANLSDFCFTVNSSRSHQPVRISAVGTTHRELAALLDVQAGDPAAMLRREGEGARIAFLFSAHDDDRAERQATALAEREPEFRAAWQRLSGTASPLTRLQLALVEVWKTWGIVPSAVLGLGAGHNAADAVAKTNDDIEPLKAAGERADLNELHKLGFRNVLEIGPASELLDDALPLAPENAASALAVSSSDPFAALAALAGIGARIDWRAVDGRDRPRRLQLPTYPFRRKRHWIE